MPQIKIDTDGSSQQERTLSRYKEKRRVHLFFLRLVLVSLVILVLISLVRAVFFPAFTEDFLSLPTAGAATAKAAEAQDAPVQKTRPEPLPDKALDKARIVFSLVRTRNVTRAMEVWDPVNIEFNNSKYEAQELMDFHVFLQKYCNFWAQLEDFIEPGSYRDDLKRSPHQSDVGRLMVCDMSVPTEMILEAHQVYKGQYAIPGEYELMRGTFLIGEGQYKEAKEQLAWAIAVSGDSTHQFAPAILDAARSLMRLIAPTIKTEEEKEKPVQD